MNSHVRMLKQLVSEGMYVIDDAAVADAILARGVLRATVPHTCLRSEVRTPQVRSFRRDDHVRSFRLERRGQLHSDC